MDVLLIGESHLTLSVRSQFVSKALPQAKIHIATNPVAVAEISSHHPMELVVADFYIDGIHPKEWPGHLYAWFPKASILVLCPSLSRVERIHEYLSDRARFVLSDMPSTVFVEHITQLAAKQFGSEHGVSTDKAESLV